MNSHLKPPQYGKGPDTKNEQIPDVANHSKSKQKKIEGSKQVNATLKRSKKRLRGSNEDLDYDKKQKVEGQGEEDSMPIKDTQPNDDDKFKENYPGNQCQYERV